jgi:hypothetical protein
MRVNVRGRPFDLPQCCACCGLVASSEISAVAGKNANRVRAQAWRFPVCAPCAQHVARLRTAEVLGRWVRFGGLGLVLLLTVAGGGASVLLVGGAMVLGLAALTTHLGSREARALCHAGCASLGPPVTFIGSFGNVEAFEFVQKGYAGDFMRANLAKLAALPHETQSYIQPDLDRVAAAEAERRTIAAAADAKRKALERERVRIAAEGAHDNEVYEKSAARMEAAKGAAGRRAALEAGLRSLRQEHMREQLTLEASRIEVSAALAKADGLKSVAAKLRTLSEALDVVRNDAVPDHLQRELIRSLEAAIARIEDEKNSIDMA